MGNKVYEVNGRMYLIDNETGKVKEVIIQEDADIPKEDLIKIIIILAKALRNKEKTE